MMKKGKISLTLIATLIATSTGVLGASSLTELRAEYGHQRADWHNAKKRHKEIRTVIEKRRVSRDKVVKKRIVKTKTIDKRVRERSKLSDAKTVQRRIDRKLRRKHAKRRRFRTAKEFRRVYGQRIDKRERRHGNHSFISAHRKIFSNTDRRENRRSGTRQRSRGWQSDSYGRGWGDGDGFYGNWEPRHVHRGYRHTRRNWYLTYLYERASFYDRHGYKYGYFSRRGFMFEGEFYRYDRYYSYRDRLRGRGLFERRYYRPSHSQFGDFFAQFGRGGNYFYAELDF